MKPFRRCIVAISLFIIVFVQFPAPSVAGNSSPGASPGYSLADLCRLALKTAETIQASENDLVIAREDKRRAMSVLMPTATAYGSYLKYREPDTERPDVNAYGIKLNQSFTLNGKELIALRITEDTIKQNEWTLQSVKDDYLYQIATAYYRIMSSKRVIDIAESDVNRLEKHRVAVNERLNVGEVTKTALFRAEAELSGAKTELVKAKNGLILARAALKNLVSIEPDFILVETGVTPFGDQVPSFEQIQEKALTNRAEIKAAQKTLDIAQKNLKYEKSAYWPRVSLEGGYADTHAEFDKPIHGSADFDDLSIQAVLTFTLFDGGLRKADIRQSTAQEEKVRLSIGTLKKGILLETEQAWLNHQTALSVLTTLKDELKSAEENFNAVTMQFKYGIADSLDMIDANTLLVTAQRKLVDAEFGLDLSILGIIRVQGEIVAQLTQ
ncbi:MAG: TolC family protein [Pseudomonadota bacterium]